MDWLCQASLLHLFQTPKLRSCTKRSPEHHLKPGVESRHGMQKKLERRGTRAVILSFWRHHAATVCFVFLHLLEQVSYTLWAAGDKSYSKMFGHSWCLANSICHYYYINGRRSGRNCLRLSNSKQCLLKFRIYRNIIWGLIKTRILDINPRKSDSVELSLRRNIHF